MAYQPIGANPATGALPPDVSQKIKDERDQAIGVATASLRGGAPANLDTLGKLAGALAAGGSGGGAGIALDTDGIPYLASLTGAGIALDTDGIPYLA